MRAYLYVALGAVCGACLRFFVSRLTAKYLSPEFPYGTLIVNVSGSLIIGFFATITGPDGRIFAGTTARQFVMIGLCGGYTTFSSFSLQTLDLMNDGEWVGAGGNIVLSVVLCLIAVWAGHVFALHLNALKWT